MDKRTDGRTWWTLLLVFLHICKTHEDDSWPHSMNAAKSVLVLGTSTSYWRVQPGRVLYFFKFKIIVLLVSHIFVPFDFSHFSTFQKFPYNFTHFSGMSEKPANGVLMIQKSYRSWHFGQQWSFRAKNNEVEDLDKYGKVRHFDMQISPPPPSKYPSHIICFKGSFSELSDFIFEH